MQKLYAHFRLLSFLFLTSVGIAQGMEGIELSPSVYESLSYYIPSLFTISEPRFIQDLRISKNNFEQELQLPFAQLELYQKKVASLDSSRSVTAQTVMHLFQYCYYYQFYYPKSIKIGVMTADLFDASKDARINGYSVLGAAIIARDVPIDTKRDLMKRLMNNGFVLTEKDKTLVDLEFCDNPENNLFPEKFELCEAKKTR